MFLASENEYEIRPLVPNLAVIRRIYVYIKVLLNANGGLKK